MFKRLLSSFVGLSLLFVSFSAIIANEITFEIGQNPGTNTVPVTGNVSTVVTNVQTTQAKKVRVLEVRYFPNPGTEIYHPDNLSPQLQSLIEESSRFQGYKDTEATPQLDVEVVEVIDRIGERPNPDGTWESTYKAILEQDNLCQKIADQNIDQLWLWVDPRPGFDPNPGLEYVINSSYFGSNSQYATVATPPLCGDTDFVFMGFDYTRQADLALHSFGHMLEGVLGNLQTVDLFWYRYGGNDDQGYPLSERCGNVHLPPNGASDYDYANNTQVSTSCEDWNPENTGATETFDCTRWGCTQEGYLLWWLQNMPAKNTHTYQGKTIPSWLSFLSDFDETITAYKNDPTYFMNYDFIGQPEIPEEPSEWTHCADENRTCSFSGTAEVRYGANDQFAYETATDNISCSNDIFGDPIWGVVKQCSYRTDGETPPEEPEEPTSKWIYCGDENQECSFSGTAEVRYGALDQYSYLVATDTVGCNNETFGDPIVGTFKQCWYFSAEVETPPEEPEEPTGEWMYCADENQSCTFSGTQEVRYGANGEYAYETATDNIACDNTTFGDPIWGVFKQCSHRPL